MRRATLFLLAATTLLSTSTGSEIINLSPITFNTVIGIATKPAVVSFYSSKNCDKCSNFNTEYKKVAEYFNADEVSVAQFDCGRLMGFCTFYDIKEYPTIKYFDTSERRGQAYSGDLRAAPIIDFIEKLVAMAPSEDDITSSATSSPETENLVGHMGDASDMPGRPFEDDMHHPHPHPRPAQPAEEQQEQEQQEEQQQQQQQGVKVVKGEYGFVSEGGLPTTAGNDGSMEEMPSGRVEALDRIAGQFVKSENKENLIEEAKKIEEKNGKYYVKYMELIVENGEEFVEKEKERLEKIIAEGTNPRLDEFVVRRNIIQAF